MKEEIFERLREAVLTAAMVHRADQADDFVRLLQIQKDVELSLKLFFEQLECLTLNIQ